MSKEEKFPIGRIVGLHGVRGEVKVLVHGEREEFGWKRVFLKTGKKGVKRGGVEEGVEMSLTVEGVRTHKGLFLVKLEGFDTREASSELIGAEVSIPGSEIPELPDDQYYYTELEDSEVFSDDGTYLGRLKNIIPTGSNDVFEVTGPLGEVLIPVTEETIRDIDLGHKKITVHLLEGLLPEKKKK